jgi:hypothetical protein
MRRVRAVRALPKGRLAFMEHLFENEGMPTRPTRGYDNEEIPDSMPLQNQGAIPVLVRLVDGELGEHFPRR